MLRLSDVKAAQGHAETRANQSHGPLEAAYRKALLFEQLRAATMFSRRATNFGRAAAGGQVVIASADWSAPTPEEVYELLLAQARIAERTRAARADLYRGQRDAWGPLGLSFELTNRLLEGVYPTLGQKITMIAEGQRAQIMALIDRAWQDGFSIRDTAGLIESQAADMTLSRAAMIARTEIIGAQNAASLATVRTSGAARYKTWLASKDQFVRPDHADADSQTVPVDQAFQVGSASMMYPGDPSGPPEEVINCRCTIIYGDEEPT